MSRDKNIPSCDMSFCETEDHVPIISSSNYMVWRAITDRLSEENFNKLVIKARAISELVKLSEGN